MDNNNEYDLANWFAAVTMPEVGAETTGNSWLDELLKEPKLSSLKMALNHGNIVVIHPKTQR